MFILNPECMNTFEASASIHIDASPEKVWETLTTPEKVKQYMFGSDVETDWKKGSKIRYTGEYEGKPFEEKGEILEVEENKHLKTTNFSSMTGQEDKPENYVTVDYAIEEEGEGTRLTITQGNIREEKSVEGSRKNWEGVLQGFKKVAEIEE